jgi:hypothetical protein
MHVSKSKKRMIVIRMAVPPTMTSANAAAAPK